ncbi:Phosphate transport ATP-binding protein PstB [Dokdonella koreensis DS-123]|uniref:Phosphate transport ATP-binding protein PstB n=1 Tax=Dokdonella koreensis DS-123 TaxID=1300342 RepID=A0A160DVJ2_9GAMM|nr:Phosphate transport ATP-binding protein PstB [Dokdonella koreensis DS-123]
MTNTTVAPRLFDGLERIVETQGLSLWYETRQVIHDVSLTIPAGRVTALIGPSGSGKTSLLRCLNRLSQEVPGSRMHGEVLLRGVPVRGADWPAHEVRRRIGMVFPRPNPFPLSVYENVAYGLRLLGLRRRRDLDAPVEEALRAVALWDEVAAQLDEPALTLAPGQQQRLAIARALILQPDVLLMDEPAAALDPQSSLRLEELLRQLGRRCTIVLATHNLQQAARVSDFAAFLNDGRLIEVNDTDTLFTNPLRRETEDYVTGRYG